MVDQARIALMEVFKTYDDALVLEDKGSPYVNDLLSRPGHQAAPDVQARAAIPTSPGVKTLITARRHGAAAAAV